MSESGHYIRLRVLIALGFCRQKTNLEPIANHSGRKLLQLWPTIAGDQVI